LARKILFQTLRDKNNPNEVRQHGPFICESENAWLGHGYYFWDTFKHLPHWWGETWIKGDYIVCKAECDFDTNICFDLYGDTEHQDLFGAILDVMRDEGLVDEETTVSDVIYHLEQKLGIFHWRAIRVAGVHTIAPHIAQGKYTFRLIFDPNLRAFLEYKPAVQICLFDKNGMGLKEYDIIFPDKYVA